MAAVSELVSALDAELVRLGYQPSTLKWYRGYWRRLERWFAAQDGVPATSLRNPTLSVSRRPVRRSAWTVWSSCGGTNRRRNQHVRAERNRLFSRC